MSDQKPEEPKLTLKQKKFLRLYFKYGNGTKAALEVYSTSDPRAASVIASENLAKLRDPIRVLMEKRGLSLGRLLDVLDEGLKAKKVITKGGKRHRKVEDYAVRHKYLETAAKWLGVDKPALQPQQIAYSSQFNFFSVSKDERNRWNEKFKKFLNSYYEHK